MVAKERQRLGGGGLTLDGFFDLVYFLGMLCKYLAVARLNCSNEIIYFVPVKYHFNDNTPLIVSFLCFCVTYFVRLQIAIHPTTIN